MDDDPTESNAASVVKNDSKNAQIYAFSWAYAKDAILAADVETGLLVDANPAIEALTGYSRDELIGRHVSLLHPEAERESCENSFREAVTKPMVIEGYHVQRKDGSQVPVDISSSRPFQVDGRSRIVGIFHDVGPREEFERRLLAQQWALSAYASAALALGQSGSVEELMQAVCEAITRESVYVLASIGFAETTPGKPIHIAASAGPARAYLDELSLNWSDEDAMGRGPASVAIRSGSAQIMEDSDTSSIFAPWRDRGRQFGIRSGVAIPFLTDGNMRGALMVYAAHPNAFNAAAVEVLKRLAEEFSHGLRTLEQQQLLNNERMRRERAQTQLREALVAAIDAVAAAMEQRDPYTSGHQRGVAHLARAIGQEMGWSEERLQALLMAGLVHDIGKISIPSEILTKPTLLSAPELALIREHPETGYTILKDVPFPWSIADVVRQHHERIDGSGYPLGLNGDAILPHAKVMAVADVVEAMSSYRPYRPALGMDFALGEIEKQAGIAFDAEIVRVCLALFRDKHFHLPAASGPRLERDGGLELER